ncbi:ABC transporter permease (plasmid) [Rhodococcus aetherivorans]|uniref:ABC transporter permease n=1 Tax=Rhodococcus aetherivorans TaxID=191292 RepID=UPI0002D23FE8|nr:ABC transporter permease [Rhodococcus aetherivorans]CCW10603.1 ABC transporter permease protein [Rhodococcus aetherivorans]
MRNYVLRRLGQAVLVLWAAYTLSYLLLSALPGDAVTNRAQNPDAQLSPEAAQQLLEYYGMDRPLWEQYLSSLAALLRGDLGFSLTNGTPVSELVAAALPSTLALTGLALVIGLALAAILGIAINYAPWGWLRGIAASIPVLFGSVPTFVVGILALQFLSFGLHLIPSTDDGSFTALFAPAATLGILISASLAQVLAKAIAKVRALPFVHVLHARGATERYIFGRGVVRNSSLPVLTLLGLACGELIAGSVVTESVYARPGLGMLTVNAVSTQDLPVLQGVVLVAALAYVSVNLLVDLAYPFIDPRILVEGGKRRVPQLGARKTPVPAPAPQRETAVVGVPAPRELTLEVSMP